MQQKQSECKPSRHTQLLNQSASSHSRHNKNYVLLKRGTMLKSIPCYRCVSLYRGGAIPACIAGGIPACLADFQAHTQGGSLGGSGQEGAPGPHPKGKLRGSDPGPHPREKLRGSDPSPHPKEKLRRIWSRPTPKEKLRGTWSRSTPKEKLRGSSWGGCLLHGGACSRGVPALGGVETPL